MAKRIDLGKAMEKSSVSNRNRGGGNQPPPQQSAEQRGPGKKGSRANTIIISAHFPPAVRTQLKMIAAERDMTVQQCLAEALNMYFVAHDRAEIAPVDRPARTPA